MTQLDLNAIVLFGSAYEKLTRWRHDTTSRRRTKHPVREFMGTEGKGPQARRPHILLIGPRRIENHVIGGDAVQFERLIADLRGRARVQLTLISTARPLANRSRAGKALLDARTFLTTMLRLWRHAAAADMVVWYVSSRGAILAGGVVWLLCVLRGRPLGIRFFGGAFSAQLAAAPAPWRFVAARTFLQADILLCQTRQLTAALGASSKTMWLPNTRDMPLRRQSYRPSCRRLLFLSRLLPEKGLPELLEAALQFPDSVRLSVFGPEMPGFDVRDIQCLPNATYGGGIAPEAVPGVMEDHDALVFPTRYYDEGYAGVVIEAFQMGLPAIVTTLPPLRELVTDGKDGLWVPAGSVDSLVDAVARICSDDQLFRHLRSGALETGDQYRSIRAATVIEDLCTRAAASSEGAGEAQ